MERLDFYARTLPCEVFVLNVDKESVESGFSRVKVINKRASGVKPLDLALQFAYGFYYSLKLGTAFNRSFESCTFIKSGLFGLATKLSGKKFIVSVHGTYRGSAETMGYKWYHKLLFRPFEWLTKKTQDLSFVIDKMYINELHWKNMHLIPNFVDDELFRPLKAKKEWQGIFVGSLTPRKGIEYLVEAIKLVRKKLPSANFAVVGHGPLENLLKKSAGGIEYLGAVPHEKLPKYYNKARFFMTATLHEGFAIPIVEAQACGLPIIASDLPPFHNNTIPGKTSLLFPARDAEKMSELVLSLCRDERKAAQMGALGRKFVEENFGKKRILKKEVELIRRLLDID
jgi:glycosyltransferase involved in cell wall biosynthesis